MAKPRKTQGVAPRNDLTAEFVRSILHYNPQTGVLTWQYRTDIPSKYITRWNQRYANTTAGEASSAAHLALGINNHSYVAHRIIWLIVTGSWPKHYIDHIDGNPHNNRWNNLREALPHQNQANQKIRINNTSGFKGASWSKRHNKWRAQINHKGTNQYLGLFPTIEEAHTAYCKAAKALHGEFFRSK